MVCNILLRDDVKHIVPCADFIASAKWYLVSSKIGIASIKL